MQCKEVMKLENLNITINWKTELSREMQEFTHAPMMVKLVSTIDEKGWPHLTFIVTNRAKSSKQIVWGQFLHGNSKEYIQKRPKHGYLYMSIEKPMQMLQIKANFKEIRKEGEDIDFFNTSKEMRYATVMNVWRVFYNDVISASPLQDVSIGKVLKGIILNKIAKGAAKSNSKEVRLDKFGRQIFTGAMNPKFIAFLDPHDGYPIVIPCFQLLAADYTKLVFPLTMYESQLKAIPENAKVAVYGMTMEFIAQVVKGTFLGFKKYRGVTLGSINIEEVYNGTPPLPGKIYPELEVLPEITEFTMPS